jgi:uncharacterized membrane protein YoaK (UPF0700 family)
VLEPLRLAKTGSLDEDAALTQLEIRLPPLLSAVAGMVDVIGYLTLGKVFTAHVTGNLVLVAALIARGNPVNWPQVLAIPIFMLAVGATWLAARRSRGSRTALTHRLTQIHFLLLAVVLLFSVVTHPSADPHGLFAGIAVLIAVSAMACQFALLRLSLPGAPSTAVMTGNLTNTVLSLLDSLAPSGPTTAAAPEHLRRSLQVLFGFFAGCVIAAAAVSYLKDWVWLLPVMLAGLIVRLS